MKVGGGPWLVGALMALVLGGCSGMQQSSVVTSFSVSSLRHPSSGSPFSSAEQFPQRHYEFDHKPNRQSPLPSIPHHNLNDIEIGIASWYGPGFHGKRTASGEIFNQYELTAAHPSLPMGTHVQVTHVETGESIKVRINDRGPYKDSRIIDLSSEAARQIGIWESGIAPVRLTVLNSDGTLPRERVLKVAAYAILISSSTEVSDSVATLHAINRKYPNAYLVELSSGALRYYQVRIGPFRSRREALIHAQTIKREGRMVLVVAEEDQRAQETRQGY
jgi:rare lipoprotein A